MIITKQLITIIIYNHRRHFIPILKDSPCSLVYGLWMCKKVI